MLELEALQALNSDIKRHHATLIGVSPQLPEFHLELVEENKFDFDFLSDTGNRVASQFGLTFQLSEELTALYKKFGINLDKNNGNSDWELPMPARFIIDTTGAIVESQVNPDYTKRPEPLKIIDILKSLSN